MALVLRYHRPELFQDLWQKRIAVLTDHKFPREPWRPEEFHSSSVSLGGGETVTLKLAERGTQLSNQFWVREIRKLSDSGHQTAILSTNFPAPLAALAAASGKFLPLHARTLWVS
jgi:hypothetical protein